MLMPPSLVGTSLSTPSRLTRQLNVVGASGDLSVSIVSTPPSPWLTISVLTW
jgi:hypothetical protein